MKQILSVMTSSNVGSHKMVAMSRLAVHWDVKHQFKQTKHLMNSITRKLNMHTFVSSTTCTYQMVIPMNKTNEID